MKVQDRIAVEADLLRRAHKKFDGVLVVQDHLRLDVRLTRRLFPEGDQSFRIQERVGVPLQAAGVPRKIDQQAVQNLFRIGARRPGPRGWRADLPKMRALGGCKIRRMVGPVLVKEAVLIPRWLA